MIRIGRIISQVTGSCEDPVVVPEPEEERKYIRSAVYIHNVLILNDGTRLTCIMRDTSRFGLRIALQGAISLPDTVLIRVDRTMWRCRVVWRTRAEAGLELMRQVRES